MQPQIIRSARQLGNAIQLQRKQRSLNQTELARLAGLYQYNISKIEQGNTGTRIGTIFDLLVALDLELVLQPRTKTDPYDPDVLD